MVRIEVPVVLCVTPEARRAIGDDIRAAGIAAFREIVVASKGVEIAHLQFRFGRLTLAACSRIRRDALVEIELGLGVAGSPTCVFTADDMRRAEAADRARARDRLLQRPSRR